MFANPETECHSPQSYFWFKTIGFKSSELEIITIVTFLFVPKKSCDKTTPALNFDAFDASFTTLGKQVDDDARR